MKAALARHDAILREAISTHRGHVVKTTGDGFHAVFARADDAVGAAIAVQNALRNETDAPMCSSSSAWGCTPAQSRSGMVTTSARR